MSKKSTTNDDEQVEEKCATVTQAELDEMFAKGKAHYDKGEYAEARQVWSEAAKYGDANSSDALKLLGESYNDDFEIKDGVLVKYKGNGGDVVIPDVVTSIGEKAFYGCSGLTSITIPNGLTSIGKFAFCECSGLTSITIPNSVTSIEKYAFSGCSGLTSITVSDGNPKYHSVCNCIIETKTKTLVAGCKNSVIPSDGSVTSIGRSAFFGCSGLTSVTIPNSVTSIGGNAFWGCIWLTSITIPNSVTSIGDNAFSGCSGLTSITVSDGNPKYHSVCNCIIETATKTLVAGCKNSVIPSDGSVTSIGNGAFYKCSGLTSITIPSSVTCIEIEAFRECSGLTSITIPNSVTSISDCAFRGCSGLTSITIPNSVTSINDCAFRRCSGLTEIKYGGTKKEWRILEKEKDWQGKKWDNDLGAYTVVCSNGKIKAKGKKAK